MKKVFFIMLAMVFVLPNIVFAQSNLMTLDEAIQVGAKNISNKLTKGSKVAILSFNSSSDKLSNYVLEELTATLVNDGKLIVVDRANLDRVRGELNFNMTGEVDDSSAQKIGRMLGAQSIILGNLVDMQDHFRIRFRTIRVENASIQAVSSINVAIDEQLVSIMKLSSRRMGQAKKIKPQKSQTNNQEEANNSNSLAFKVTIDPLTGIYSKGLDVIPMEELNHYTTLSFTLIAEFLFPVSDYFKVGLGAQYVAPRNIEGDIFVNTVGPFSGNSITVNAENFSWIPVYATIQLNPSKNSGFYIKGDIGYNVLFNFDLSFGEESMDKTTSGGLYFGFATGYEFQNGFLFEISYNTYYASFAADGISVDITHDKLGVGIGYKFNL